jgi:ribonuclease-3
MTEFGRAYGITFRDPVLLKLALTHRSYLHVTGQGPRESNERLEFLGDSVLGLVTSEFLYRSHPSEHEGQLTKTKSLLVSKAILSRRALAMGLGRFVLMSHAEVESGGRQRLSILADAFESVIGAIYLDQGFEAARAFIDRWLLRESKVIAADRRHTNYKSHLQEYVQSTFRTHPVYRIRSEMGPDHSKQFMVEVMVGRRVLGEGRGRNKKEAEQAAARNALEAVESGPVSDREKRREERVIPREGGERESGGRESGGREAGARESGAPQSGRAAPAARPVEADDEESGEAAGNGEEHGRRRRRGRRGGRSRREREPNAVPGTATPPPAGGAPRTPAAPERSESAPPAARAVTPMRTERPTRLTPPPPLPVLPTPVEIEPRPPASDEDENEEVGRPEGPHEERHIDPYAWGSRSRPAVESEPTRPARREPEPARPVRRQPEPVRPAAMEPMRETMREPERPAMMGPETFEPVEMDEPMEPGRPEPEEEPWVPATPAEPEAEPSAEEPEEAEPGPRYPEVEAPPPPPAAPTWGRRNRRGR